MGPIALPSPAETAVERLFFLPKDVAVRLAAHCAANAEKPTDVLVDLVVLGLDELEEQENATP